MEVRVLNNMNILCSGTGEASHPQAGPPSRLRRAPLSCVNELSGEC